MGRWVTIQQRMDLVMTVAQYTQVSMMLNSFGVQLDEDLTLDLIDARGHGHRGEELIDVEAFSLPARRRSRHGSRAVAVLVVACSVVQSHSDSIPADCDTARDRKTSMVRSDITLIRLICA